MLANTENSVITVKRINDCYYGRHVFVYRSRSNVVGVVLCCVSVSHIY